MADDQTNPYVTMGMLGMYAPNKYISPQYRDQPLPMPGFYGTPTDAQGNPIQSYTDAQKAHDAWAAANPAPVPGTTLNSNPSLQQGYNQAMLNATLPNGPDQMGNRIKANIFSQAMNNPSGPMGQWAANMGYGTGARGAGGAGGAAGGANPVNMRQAYLDALANPGKVTTPGVGASGQSAPLGQPSVLDAFLSTHSAGPAAPAGGGYSNKGFFDTLSKLRSA